MFPRYLSQEERIIEALNRAWRYEMKRRDPVLGQVRRKGIHEGRAFAVQRQDGQTSTNSFVEHESQLEFDLFKVPEMSVSDLVEIISPMIDEMIHQQGTHMFAKLDEEVGTVSSEGSESASETQLRALEATFISFDHHGTPHLPALIMSPDVAKRVAPELEAAQADPQYQKRLKEIVDRKREEWRAHEASRRLVD